MYKRQAWLNAVLDERFKVYFDQNADQEIFSSIPAPELTDMDSPYVQTVRSYEMGVEHRVMLLLAMAPHIAPQLLDIFLTKNKLYNRGFTEFGGILGQNHSGMMPTGETIIFVLAGGDLEKRFRLMPLFAEDHYFFKHNMLKRFSQKREEPTLSNGITVSQEFLTRFTTGEDYQPPFSNEFPAQKLKTALDWKDLILEDSIYDEIEEMLAWIEHQNTIMVDWGLSKKLKRGYRALFYGPPGTGKTLTASLLGKATNMEVYRIDLSQIVSKYIGETEKNLSKLFDKAKNKNWILFFDEADSIFGKRTNVRDAHDKYANQEVSYLLQRIENYPGLTILASNFKTNIDDAFIRRFNSLIYFPSPKAPERLQLWQKAFPKNAQINSDVNFHHIAEQYELTGSHIMNVVQHACLQALNNESHQITASLIKKGIIKEFAKEGKVM